MLGWSLPHRCIRRSGSIRTSRTGFFLAWVGRSPSPLVLHLVALLVVMGIRLAPHGERPLAAVEVNLVNLPTPVKTVEQPRPVEPVKRLEPKPSPVSSSTGQDCRSLADTGVGAGAPQCGERYSERS